MLKVHLRAFSVLRFVLIEAQNLQTKPSDAYLLNTAQSEAKMIQQRKLDYSAFFHW